MKSYSASVQADIAAPQAAAFDCIVPIDLTSIFTGYGPLPAVVGTRDQTGGWDAAGQTRTVLLAGGSSAHEQITDYTHPSHFSYTVSDFTGILRPLVVSAHGEFWFEPGTPPAGTHVKWTYTFNARSSFSVPLVWFIATVLWKGYMDKALRISKAQAERQATIARQSVTRQT
jgi:hypothetical protein